MLPVGTPFIVLGLPRCRTFWSSKFLTYGRYHCWHEQAPHLRSLEDAQGWLSQDFTGTAETGIASWWRLILRYRPDIRIVVVRRPVEEVVESLMRLDMQGVCTFDRDALTKGLRRIDAKLRQIEHCAPSVLAVQFADLDREDVCARVFEHCLPYPHDHAHWASLARTNLQASMPALMRHLAVSRPALDKLVAVAKHRSLAMMAGRKTPDVAGVTFQQERFDEWFTGAEMLLREHCSQIGEAPDNHHRKNLRMLRLLDRIGAMQITTARSNGRMFGYLMTIVGPSLEDDAVTSAQALTFFASPDFPGLGIKLQRASLTALRERGIGEVFARAGVRGSGPKMGALYRRLGFEDFGQMFKLTMEAA